MKRAFNIEVKAFTGDSNSDLLQSILSGHAYEQVLKLREMGDPCMVLVLGNKKDLAEAIQKSVVSRGIRNKDANMKISMYSNLVKDFCRKCDLLGVKVWFNGDWPWFTSGDVWKDLLHYISLFFDESGILEHRPKPPANERMIASLCMHLKDVGPVRARSILEYYGNLREFYRSDLTDLESIDGIGKKTAETIRSALK